MPDAAICQVEDLIKAQIEGYAPLSGWTVVVDESADIAVDPDRRIVIHTVAVQTDTEFGDGQTNHNATIDIAVVSDKSTAGVIGRNNHNALAHIVAALHQDRTLGGKVQDIQELDVAAPTDGRDVGDASLQVRVEFATPRGDWFTLVF